MAIKVQINSLQALERLIGDDTETEIEIRNSIAQEFAKKYLKSLVTEELEDALRSKIRKEINDSFFTMYDNGGYGNFTEIAPDKAHYIQELVKDTVDKEIFDSVQNAIDNLVSIKRLEKTVDDSANYIAEEMTKENLNQRINQLVDKKIKEKLDLK